MTSKRKEGYKVRKEQGKCYRCFAKDPAPGQRRCQNCIDQQRAYNRLYLRRRYK